MRQHLFGAYKKIAALLCAAALSCSIFASAAQAGCANREEFHALNMRALQSDLMVAALACGQKLQYNQYIRASATNLRQNANAMRGYFSRLYGASGEYQMNRFVTQMANQASRISLNSSDSAYCGEAMKRFVFLQKAMPWQVEEYTRTHYQAWHAMPSCPSAKMQVANAARK